MRTIPCTAKLVLLVAVCAFALLLTGGPPDTVRADAVYGSQMALPSSAQKIGAFEDVVVGPGEIWQNVVVVGGDVTVLGTVENVVVVVGGDVSIGPGARVGVGGDPEERAVVVVFGDVKVDAGATVDGEVFDGLRAPDWLGAAAVSPDYESWNWGSLAGWVWMAVFLAIVAVIVAAIAPRQLAFVRERVRGHFFSSLGWGALLVVIAVPLITILLIVTLVGIILLLPWLGVVLPVLSLFGFVSVGAMVGRIILGKREDDRGSLMLAAVLGVVILSVLWWIPIAGGVILFLLGLVGFGATCVAVWDWRRRSARARRKAPAGGAPTQAAPGYRSTPDSAPPSATTPEPIGELPPAETRGDQNPPTG